MFHWLVNHRKKKQRVAWNASEGQYGLCDRLRGLACGLAWSIPQQRLLCYRWEPNDLCPAEFCDLFEPSAHALIKANLGQSWPDNTIHLQIAANPLPHHFWKYVHEKGHPGSGFKSLDHFKAAWKHELRSLRPVAPVRKAIKQCLRAANGRTLVGIHLRRTDVVHEDCKPEINADNIHLHNSGLLAQIRSLASTNRDFCFYLASDSQEHFHRVSSQLRNECIPFIHHGKEWTSNFRQTQVADAVVDLWMLGSCAHVIGTVDSGFLLIASALGARTQVLKVPQNNTAGSKAERQALG